VNFPAVHAATNVAATTAAAATDDDDVDIDATADMDDNDNDVADDNTDDNVDVDVDDYVNAVTEALVASALTGDCDAAVDAYERLRFTQRFNPPAWAAAVARFDQ
jgi:hypothetical protein